MAVFGSTGSVGRAVLDVIGRMPGRFEVTALAARSSTRLLAAQAHRFRVPLVATTDMAACRRLRSALEPEHEVLWGINPLLDIAGSPRTDILVMAMSGTMGILPTLAALERGTQVCLATKELLVAFGDHLTRTARRSGARLLPVDSELCAIHQCIRAGRATEVNRVYLTASGGPFWRNGFPRRVRLDDVLRHPTWKMGRKITVDSATMMNKGLEVIETCRLFGLAPGRVEAVIHPGSLVHALVEFCDGSIVAQLSRPDMRLPIQYCLAFPDRVESPVGGLDLVEAGRLDFHRLVPGRFPCYDLARRALEQGPAWTCALNAANQVAVDAFLAGRIAFAGIPATIDATLKSLAGSPARLPSRPGVRRLLEIEAHATALALGLAAKHPRGGER